jgi:hypothetical protein
VTKSHTRKKFFGIVGGNGAVPHRRDDLAQGLLANVPHGIDPGEIGLGGLVCHDIALFVQKKLLAEERRGGAATDADEDAVREEAALLSRFRVLHREEDAFVPLL